MYKGKSPHEKERRLYITSDLGNHQPIIYTASRAMSDWQNIGSRVHFHVILGTPRIPHINPKNKTQPGNLRITNSGSKHNGKKRLETSYA